MAWCDRSIRGAIVVLLAGSPAAGATYFDYKVSQVLSIGELGDLANQVFAVDFAAGLGLKPSTPLTIDGIGWDLELSSFGPSKLSDMRLYIDDMAAPDGDGIFVRPGAGFTRAGVCRTVSPIIDLTSIGLLDLPLPTGVARLEFHETIDDPDVKIDGMWISGTIRFSLAEALPSRLVPLPSAAASGVLGLGVLLPGLRRRPR